MRIWISTSTRHISYWIKIMGVHWDFLGENTVNYAEVCNSSENFTLMPLVRGGFYARIESVFVIFKNVNESYPIEGVQGEMQKFPVELEREDGWTDVYLRRC